MHDIHSEIAQADILSLGASGAERIQLVVGELDLANAEVVEEVDVPDVAVEVSGVLEIQHHPELPLPLGLQDVRGAANMDELVAVSREVAVPGREIANRGLVRKSRSSGGPERDAEHGETGF